ncbi:MAG: hypothetical protein PHX18_04675 [Candidatus Gastranaerophilales bacterium]|nr:hypothetical protein [Candidatus Gastranaerophilales bacterium]
MAVGARDHIDKLLVRKYAELKVENHESLKETQIDEQKMLANMQNFANDKLAMLKMKDKLNVLGNKLLAKSAYKNYRYIPV